MLRPATAHQLQSNRPEPDLQGRRDHVNCSAYKNGVDANQRMISDHTKMTDNRILDDKTGRLIRYATLSLLYLVQVRAFMILKKIVSESKPVAGCSLWISNFLPPSPAQTGWPLLL